MYRLLLVSQLCRWTDSDLYQVLIEVMPSDDVVEAERGFVSRIRYLSFFFQ